MLFGRSPYVMKIQLAAALSTLFLSCQHSFSTRPGSQNELSADTTVTRADSIQSETDTSLILNYYLVNHKRVTEDFLFVSENCAICVSPDSMEIESMKKKYGEEDFSTIADDAVFYNYQASFFLDTMGIKTIYPRERYLKFKIRSDTICLDTKSKYKAEWLSILYKTNVLPKIYNTIDAEQAYKNYYQ